LIPFIPSPAPFADFLIIRDKRTAKQEPKTSNLICRFFSGSIFLQGELIKDSSRITSLINEGKLTLKEFESLAGSFAIILGLGDKNYVFTDRMGYCKVFYYEDENWLLVSNRIHALTQAMYQNRIPRKPNYAAIALSLYSDHTWFYKTNSHSTIIDRVFLIPIDQYLEIGSSQLKLKSREAVTSAFSNKKLSPSEYRSLLEEGCAEVVSNLKSVINNPEFNNNVIELTGGRDSRLVYSATVKAGLINKVRIETYTNQPKHDADLRISNIITSIFGGTYTGEEERQRWFVSPEAALAITLSMEAGISNIPAWSTFPSLGQAHNMALISGGSGECYRGVYYDLFELKKNFDPDKPEDYIGGIFKSLVKINSLPKEFREESFIHFKRSIESLPGDDVRWKVENHYAYFRSRGHFGNREIRHMITSQMFSPLDSLKLIRSSRSLDFDLFAKSVAEFDIVDALAPELNFIELDKDGHWASEIMQRSSILNNPPQFLNNIDISKKYKEWELGKAALKESNSKKWREATKIRPQVHANDFWPYVKSICLKAAEEMISKDQQLAQLLTEEVVRKTIDSFDPEPGYNALRYSMRMLEIYTLCFDQETRALKFTNNFSNNEYQSHSECIKIFSV